MKKKNLARAITLGLLLGSLFTSNVFASITDTKTPPKMIGFGQTWDTDIRDKVLGTSIKAYQYQGNSIQLNSLQFKDVENKDGSHSLGITLGASVDGINKNATIYFKDRDTDTTATIVGDSKNVVVSETGKNASGGIEYKVSLKDDVEFNNVKVNKAITIGDKVTVDSDGLTAGDVAVTVDGVNAGNKKVSNVSDGEISATSKDAVNGSQLYATNQNITNINNRVDKLDGRVDKVGAGAAALAALHPLDFDPDDKLTFSAGMGNYRGENAAAIGAFYRPDEKTMLSVGGTVGNGENMVNVGLSFALDRTNRVTNSRTAMAKEIVELRAQVAELSALVGKMAAQNGMTNEMKLFPDVAENHWAYEYVGKLAAAGIIEGYPDGNFGGDRMMSRYEFAAMLYRAMQNGAMLDSKIIKEFEPELGRIRVDRIHGEDSDRHKVERVRVNGQKGRDVYGSVLPVEK